MRAWRLGTRDWSKRAGVGGEQGTDAALQSVDLLLVRIAATCSQLQRGNHKTKQRAAGEQAAAQAG